MKRAFSLAEMVIAVFLLLVGGLACLELVVVASRHQSSAAQEIAATQLAEQTLDRIREWAYDPAHFRGDWTLYDNDRFQDPLYPGFEVEVRSGPKSSPPSWNTGLERSEGSRQRLLTNSTMALRVAVRWGQGRVTSLVSLIGEPLTPVRSSSPVRVRRIGGGAGPLARDEFSQWACDLYGSDDEVITGVVFSWSVVPFSDATHPQAGNAWLDVPREKLGREVTVYHHFYNGDPALNLDPHYVGGSIKLHAETVYGGRSYSQESDVVELQGP